MLAEPAVPREPFDSLKYIPLSASDPKTYLSFGLNIRERFETNRRSPPAAVLDALSRHKIQIVALLRRGRDNWSDMDWLAFFDERAGIAEFDGGLPRSSAEARAFECCVVEWLNRNPTRSLPGQCAGCGGPNHEHDVLLPYGVEPAGLTWLHSRCWSAWHSASSQRLPS